MWTNEVSDCPAWADSRLWHGECCEEVAIFWSQRNRARCTGRLRQLEFTGQSDTEERALQRENLRNQHRVSMSLQLSTKKYACVWGNHPRPGREPCETVTGLTWASAGGHGREWCQSHGKTSPTLNADLVPPNKAGKAKSERMKLFPSYLATAQKELQKCKTSPE